MDIRIIASGSAGNAYRVSDGKTQILLDAGIPISRIRVGCDFKMMAISGCLITHAHGDHSKAARDIAKIGIDVYTSQGTIDACGLQGHRYHAIQSLKEFRIGTIKVLPFDVRHDAPEPLGYLLHSIETGEKLLYFTDTFYVRFTFTGLTHIMAEANYDTAIALANMADGRVDKARTERLMESHMSIDHLMDFLKANDMSKVRQIYLLHLSDDNSDAEEFADRVRRETGAEVYTT